MEAVAKDVEEARGIGKAVEESVVQSVVEVPEEAIGVEVV